MRPPKVKRMLVVLYPLGCLGLMSFLSIGVRPITPYLKAIRELLYAETPRSLEEIIGAK